MPPSLFSHTVRAGPAAFYLYASAPPSAALSRHLGAIARPPWPEGVRDVIPGYASLLVEHDPDADQGGLEAHFLEQTAPQTERHRFKTHTLAVRYGEAADQAALTERFGLPWEEVTRVHQAVTYTVAFLGFTPGFPYLLGLPAALWTPRRATPRPVRAGAVAIAAAQAGIYPAESPGGWWVLGRTDAPLYTPEADPPTLLAPGDRVRFRAVAALSERSSEPTPPDRDAAPILNVVKVLPGTASVQGPPRWGVGRYGLAQSGALDRLAHTTANALVGNPPEALAAEILGQALTLRAATPLTVAVAGGGLRLELNGVPAPTWTALEVAQGATLALVPDPARGGMASYLAVAGGLHAPERFGSGSADARGRMGYVLQPGDLLRATQFPPGHPVPHPGRPRYSDRVTLRLHPGPQYEPGAFARLLGSSFRVRTADRMGARLAGPPVTLASHEVTSEGNPWGAVQIPPDGQPILLLADRGRTGGYAKPAVVDARDLWRLAQARPGTEVVFEAATLGG